jgi:hypothetical protein
MFKMGRILKKNMVIILSFIIVLSGFLVIAGWVFGITAIISISPSWVSMKFTTAIAFVLSGIILYFIKKAQEGWYDIAQVVISIATMVLLLLMGTMFLSSLLGVVTGLEDAFIRDTGVLNTVIPGRPSTVTMVDFLLVSSGGILTLLKTENQMSKLKVIGFIIILTGTTAVIGYLTNLSVLYYYLKGINSAMALNTAILFILMGTGFVCLSD